MITFGPTDALIRIDITKAFMTGGGLPVQGGEEIVPGANEASRRMHVAGGDDVLVVDFHPEGHHSFASTHGVAPFSIIEMPYGKQVAWPDHAKAGTFEVEFHDDLDTSHANIIIRKGMNPLIDSYSAFRENDKTTSTGLGGYLRARGIRRVFCIGLAWDYCVGYSAIDAALEGFESYAIKDLSRAISTPLTDSPYANTVEQIEAEFAANNVRIINFADIAQ